MQHPDEGTIHAWLDGALPDGERVDVEQHVASCVECSLVVAEARGTIAGASRIVGALDMVPGGVVPKSIASPQAQPLSLWRMLRITPARAALAASLLVAASIVVTKRHDTPDKMVPHAPVAVVRQDSVIVPATPPIVPPTSSVAPRPPTAAPPLAAKVAQKVDSVSRDTTTQALVATSAAPAPASSARLSFSATRMSELARNRADAGASVFVGCYSIGPESARDAGLLPERFALELPAESAIRAQNIVRGVTPEGRIGSVLAGSSWRVVTPTLSNVSLASPSGERRLNVGLTPSGSVIASVATDTVPKQIALSRIACTP